MVGTAADLPLPRRAQLGVLAHIRHTYTNYDQLLKICGWAEARAAVEPLCLEKIAQWRGDDDDTDAMSDILREVIVIPDDEEENGLTSGMDSISNGETRETSVEIVATQAAEDGVHVRQVTYRRSPKEGDDTDVDSDGPSMGTYRAPSTDDRSRLDRGEAHRHKKWAAARSRYRNEPHNENRNNDHDISIEHGTDIDERLLPGLHAGPSSQAPLINQTKIMNDNSTYDDRIPHAPAMQNSYSPHREAINNRIVDLTTGRPYQQISQAALVSLVIDSTKQIEAYSSFEMRSMLRH